MQSFELITAGGTHLVDYMKLNVETPRRVVDINHLPLDKIEPARVEN